MLLPAAAETAWMHKVAAEMNLSETAFLTRRAEGEFDLRWFTPAVEVDLCGHATLASAHALWQGGHVPASTPLQFHTKSGVLTATPAGGWIELDFPATHVKAAEPPDGLLDALRAQAKYVGRSKFDYLVEVGSEDTVRDLTPDFAALRTEQRQCLAGFLGDVALRRAVRRLDLEAARRILRAGVDNGAAATPLALQASRLLGRLARLPDLRSADDC